MAPTRSSMKKSAAVIAVKREDEAESSESTAPHDVNGETTASTSHPGISEYELARLENIRRNEQFLTNLGLDAVRSNLTTYVPQSKKPRLADRSFKKEVQQPVRRSGRVTLERLASEIRALRATGQLSEAEQKEKEHQELAESKKDAYEMQTDEREEMRISSEPISLDTLLGISDDDDDDDDDDDEEAKTTTAAHDKKRSREELEKVESKDTAGQGTRRSQFASTLRQTLSSIASSSSFDQASSMSASMDAYAAYTLQEHHVVKLTPSRITAVAMHPSTQRIVAAAADKYGHVSLWTPDLQVDAPDSQTPRVFRFRPHSASVPALCFPDAHRLWSASYDGSLRLLDLLHPDPQMTCVLHPDLDHSPALDSDSGYITDCCQGAHPQTVWMSRSGGCVHLIDMRSAHRTQSLVRLFDCKVNGLSLHPAGVYLASASSREGVALHDLRRTPSNTSSNTAVVRLRDHSKAVSGVAVAPSGQLLVSVSYDDTVRSYAWRDLITSHDNDNDTDSGKTDKKTKQKKEKKEEATAIRGAGEGVRHGVLAHNNNTGRWLSSFRPAFDPKHPEALILGSMSQPRRIEVFSAQRGGAGEGVRLRLQMALQAQSLGSVCSRNAAHPTLEAVLGGNSSGRVHLFTHPSLYK